MRDVLFVITFALSHANNSTEIAASANRINTVDLPETIVSLYVRCCPVSFLPTEIPRLLVFPFTCSPTRCSGSCMENSCKSFTKFLDYSLSLRVAGPQIGGAGDLKANAGLVDRSGHNALFYLRNPAIVSPSTRLWWSAITMPKVKGLDSFCDRRISSPPVG